MTAPARAFRDLRQFGILARRRPLRLLGPVAVLAVGVGMAVAMFALADPFVARPLPYERSHELVSVRPNTSRALDLRIASPDLLDIRQRTEIFADAAAFTVSSAARVQAGGERVSLNVSAISTNLLQVLGGQAPLLASAGRDEMILTAAGMHKLRISADMAQSGAISAQWSGRTIRIIGVVPSSFLFPSNHAVFPPEALVPIRDSALRGGTIVARLRPGATAQSAESRLNSSLGYAPGTMAVVPLVDQLRRAEQRTAEIALAAGLIIFLLASANCASLQLAALLRRREEFRTRASVGATAADLARLVGIEHGVVSVAGTVGGVLIARVVLAWAVRGLPLEFVALGEPQLGLRAVIVGLGCAAFSWSSARLITRQALGGVYQRSATGRGLQRQLPLAIQGGLSAVLLVASSMLVESYARLEQRDTGFSGSVLAVKAQYAESIDGVALSREVDEALRSLRARPEIESSAALIGSLLDRTIWTGAFVVGGETISVGLQRVTPDYFKTMGTPLLEGRPLNEGDVRSAGVVVNESLARLLPRVHATGLAVGVDGGSRIVGVAKDQIDVSLDAPLRPTVYLLLHNPESCSGDCNFVTYLTRVRSQSAQVDQTVEAILRASPGASIKEVGLVHERLSASVLRHTVVTVFASVLGCAGLAMTLLSISSTILITIATKRREIGIRRALGAQNGATVWSVAREAVYGVATGLAVGLGLGQWIEQALKSMVYGAGMSGWLHIVLAATMVLVATLIAAVAAGVGAVRVPPLAALQDRS